MTILDLILISEKHCITCCTARCRGVQFVDSFEDSALTQGNAAPPRFSSTKRKHHCRACGRVVCGSCSANKLFLPSYSKDDRTRAKGGGDGQKLIEIVFFDSNAMMFIS